jgi:hypothetical protein
VAFQNYPDPAASLPRKQLSPAAYGCRPGESKKEKDEPYLSSLGLFQLLLLAPLHLLQHLGLHNLFGLLHPPQNLGLDFVAAPLELLGHSLGHELLDALVGRGLDRLLLLLFLPPETMVKVVLLERNCRATEKSQAIACAMWS